MQGARAANLKMLGENKKGKDLVGLEGGQRPGLELLRYGKCATGPRQIPSAVGNV